MGVKRRTSPKKLRNGIAKFTEWSKTIGSMNKEAIFKRVNSMLRGHYNYYGVIGNYKSLGEFYYRVMKILYKWLRRKSFRRRLNWEKFNFYLTVYNIEKPRIVHVFY